MSVLKVSDDTRDYIFSLLNDNEEIDLLNIDILNKIVGLSKRLIDVDGFLIIRNFKIGYNHRLLKYFSESFGDFYGQIESTNIKIDCKYTGCYHKNIGFHNDDAIDLLHQPRYGFISVKNEDPLGMGETKVVYVDELVRHLKHESPDFLDQLLTTPIPMLSYGINYEDEEKVKIETFEPILYISSNGSYMFRFDLTRNKFYYKINKDIYQSAEESMMLFKFSKLLSQIYHAFTLKKGDLFIFDNKRTLHDRGECSFEINLDGSINTREISVTFSR